ncbi:unnamed protein product, partial [marine sediment metagenome]
MAERVRERIHRDGLGRRDVEGAGEVGVEGMLERAH